VKSRRTISDALSKGSSKVNRSQGKVSEHDFQPLRKLGRGSFGDVYLVRHVTDTKNPGTIYAMKTLSKRNNLEESWIRYVRTERDVLAYSDNPFIVKLRYAFQTKKKLFLIIDFCPGGDLETLLSNEHGPLHLEKAKLYIAEILLALRDLHARNVIYRDLKPDNVVIDNDGHAQLIDFGMAKQDISEVQKGAKTFCGSVKYLAPEMLKKMGHG
jgi:serine/threonine protein kinase